MSDTPPFKKFFFWLFIFCGGLVTASILFIAAVSIYVGLNHIHKDGFWAPILFGFMVTVLILWLFLYGIVYIRRQLKEKDIIHHI